MVTLVNPDSIATKVAQRVEDESFIVSFPKALTEPDDHPIAFGK